MQFRLATPADKKQVVAVLEDGRASLAAQGSDQWQGGAPFESIVTADIEAHVLWVAEIDGTIVGTITIIETGEDDYRRIESGAWLTNSAHSPAQGTVTYAVFHRVAVHHNYLRQGVASFLLESGCKLAHEHGLTSVRVDTHEKNIPMQTGFVCNGFSRCCEITITNPFEPTKKRIGFERIL